MNTLASRVGTTTSKGVKQKGSTSYIVPQSNNVDADLKVAYVCARYLEQPLGRYYFCHISLSQNTLSGKEFNLFHSLPPRTKVSQAVEKLLTQAAFLMPGLTTVYHSGFNLGNKTVKPMQTTPRGNVVKFVEIPIEQNAAAEKLEQQVKEHYLDEGKNRGNYYGN